MFGLSILLVHFQRSYVFDTTTDIDRDTSEGSSASDIGILFFLFKKII